MIIVNGNLGSNDNVALNTIVTLASSTVGSTYLWSIVSQPSGTPNAFPADPALSATTFLANKEGSYLIRLIVDATLPTETVAQAIVAVRELQTGNRIPAAGETTENNAETGWANTAVDQILQRVTRFTDQGVIVGSAGASGLQPLDVVYVSDVVTIATGGPGQRDVPQFSQATAAAAPTIYGLLGVVLSGVDGSSTPAAGDLIRVAVLTTLRSVSLGTPGATAGTAVYVDDAGHLSLTPGTFTRQIGTVIDDMGGGLYGVYVTGEGSFGTLQALYATAPITTTGGVDPHIGLDYNTGNLTLTSAKLNLTQTGVSPGTYGEAAPAYPGQPASILSQFTVDVYGRLSSATTGPLTIGGTYAKTYVDNGDATTLAAAEAYAQTLAYGLSSKVPVHVATLTGLPSYTVNGTFQTLTATANGPLPAIDGHVLLLNERILVKNESAQANNGIYVLTQEGSLAPNKPWILTRADDANSAAELCGSLVTVNVGTTQAGSTWIFAYNPASFTLGSTPVVFTQLNATPATATVLGTVKLAGGLGGGGTADAPILKLDTGYVSGVLPIASGGTNSTAVPLAGGVAYGTGTAFAFASAGTAGRALISGGAGAPSFAALNIGTATNISGTLGAANGGTGLTTSSALNAFLVGDGSGAWTTRTGFLSDSCLAGTIAQPLTLQARGEGVVDMVRVVRKPATAATAFWLFTPSCQSLNIQPRIETGETQGSTPGNTQIAGETAVGAGKAGGTVTVSGGDTNAATGGTALVVAGNCYGAFKAPAAYLRGGYSMTAGQTSGDAYVQGGTGNATSGNGGDVFVNGGTGTAGLGGAVHVAGGSSASGGNGATVFISAGAGAVALEFNGGNVEIAGGAGYGGGDVLITPGAGASVDGSVKITRRPGSSTGQITIADAFINGTGTAGQLFTSNGAGTQPSWQDPAYGAAGSASLGAFRATSVSSITITNVDYCVVSKSPLLGTNTTVTLSAASTFKTGQIIIIKSRNSLGTVTVDANGTERIDGSSSSRTLALNDVLRIIRTNDSTTEWIEI